MLDFENLQVALLDRTTRPVGHGFAESESGILPEWCGDS
jgi:hypothetical protein